MLNAGKFTVTGCVIDHNLAAAGGGLDNAGGTLVVTGSRIEFNNGGVYGGGGIQNGGPRNLPGSVRVVSSTIVGNTTRNEGGGIFSGQNGHPSAAGLAAAASRRVCPPIRCRGQRALMAAALTLTVLRSNVSGNRGANGGGGIAAEGPASVVSSMIEGNSAGQAVGGGVFDVTSVRASLISHNNASTGGGVEAFPGLHMTITTSTLDGNFAGSYGGAIDESGEVVVTRSTMAGNRAGGSRFAGAGAAVILGAAPCSR